LRAGFEVVEVPVGAQERLLYHVFGVVLVACHSEGQSVHRAAVPLHQDTKGLGLAAAHTRDRLGIGLGVLHPFPETLAAGIG
jgi:hypothetical protein